MTIHSKQRRRRRRRRSATMLFSRVLSVVVLAVGASMPSCRPDLDDRESLVTRTRVLAVRGEPPEAKPGVTVSYSILVATPDGPITTPLTSWALCTTPKLLTENGAVSAACIDGTGSTPLAEGISTIDTAMPLAACSLFGPEITSAELRPRDPDITGGYYQPLRVTVFGTRVQEGAEAFGLERIACNLANASADVARAFGQRYVANRNPEIVALTARTSREGTPIPLDAIGRGTAITLRASWSEASAERYVVYDLATRALVDHRETMRVSWYATAGTFANDRTGRGEEEGEEVFTENEWTAPSDPITTHLFVVLRDARGGVTFATYTMRTQ